MRIRRLAPVLLSLLTACALGSGVQQPLPPPSIRPLPTLRPSATGAPAEVPDTGWLPAGPGAELRRLRVTVGAQQAPVSVVRLDPAQLRFSVGYRADTPPLLSEWAASTKALAVINGSFFDESGHPVALLVHEGQVIGTSYEGRGGMFAVDNAGTVSLRALADTPYNASEPLAEALQGWPMLVRSGAAVYSYEDAERDRRSVLATDQAGNVLLIVAPTPAFTLAELSTWLATSDLAVEQAVNLDGGSSTGLLLASATHAERIEAFAPLPIVLMALPR